MHSCGCPKDQAGCNQTKRPIFCTRLQRELPSKVALFDSEVDRPENIIPRALTELYRMLSDMVGSANAHVVIRVEYTER